jgi:hypothetical protein
LDSARFATSSSVVTTDQRTAAELARMEEYVRAGDSRRRVRCLDRTRIHAGRVRATRRAHRTVQTASRLVVFRTPRTCGTRTTSSSRRSTKRLPSRAAPDARYRSLISKHRAHATGTSSTPRSRVSPLHVPQAATPHSIAIRTSRIKRD